MRRPQFSIKTMLWLMAVVAAFMGGMAMQRKFDEPVWRGSSVIPGNLGRIETLVMPDGTSWSRVVDYRARSDYKPSRTQEF
jgi:hypothetical protein